jgi:hypothetical protein
MERGMAEWQYWPAATVEERPVLIETFESGRVVAERTERALVILRNRETGVPYPLAPHTACWRSYGDLLVGSPAGLVSRLRRFTRFYGPLVSAFADDEPFGRSGQELARDLGNIGALWTVPGSDQISYWRTTAPSVAETEAAERSVHFLHMWMASRSAPPPIGSLLRFMFLQALRQHTEHTPHRKCAGCGYWMELTRRNRQHCTPRCRKAHSRQSAGLGY